METWGEIQPWTETRASGQVRWALAVGQSLSVECFIITIPAIHLGGWSILKIFAEKGSSFFKISEAYAPLYLWLLSIIVVFALVTFFLPLFKVHWIMEKWRKEKQRRLCQIEYYINQLESRLLNETEKLDQKEFESIQKELEKMRHTYMRNEKLPVWPFNMEIMSKLLVSQIIPVVALSPKLCHCLSSSSKYTFFIVHPLYGSQNLQSRK